MGHIQPLNRLTPQAAKKARSGRDVVTGRVHLLQPGNRQWLQQSVPGDLGGHFGPGHLNSFNPGASGVLGGSNPVANPAARV
jgi:hypothetical protein